MALPVTYPFTGTNNDPLSASFISFNWKLFGGRGEPTAGDAVAWWSDDIPNADQYAIITIYNNAGLWIGVGVRLGVGRGYAAYFVGAASDLSVVRIDSAGSYTVLNTFTGLTAPDGTRLKLTVSGTTLKVFLDTGSGFVQVGSDVTDSTYTTGGSFGPFARFAAGQVDDFEGGNLVTLATFNVIGRTVFDYIDF